MMMIMNLIMIKRMMEMKVTAKMKLTKNKIIIENVKEVIAVAIVMMNDIF
jgi:hypothetical protein